MDDYIQKLEEAKYRKRNGEECIANGGKGDFNRGINEAIKIFKQLNDKGLSS